jgi:hypothetical protein
MPEYIAYLIGRDGHFFKAEELVCDGDEVAIETAKQWSMVTMLSFGNVIAKLRSSKPKMSKANKSRAPVEGFVMTRKTLAEEMG